MAACEQKVQESTSSVNEAEYVSCSSVYTRTQKKWTLVPEKERTCQQGWEQAGQERASFFLPAEGVAQSKPTLKIQIKDIQIPGYLRYPD